MIHCRIDTWIGLLSVCTRKRFWWLQDCEVIRKDLWTSQSWRHCEITHLTIAWWHQLWWKLLNNFAMFYLLMQDYGVSVENIFPVEPSACPPLVEIKKLPNKVVLWCGKISVLINSYILFSLRLLPGLFTLFLLGTRSSNMLRHLQKGFLPSVCSLPVPGYMVILIVYNFSASIFWSCAWESFSGSQAILFWCCCRSW
jgi:hypothetical protein